MANTFLLAILAAAALLAVGLALRANLRVLQVLYIPAAVVGGVIGFALVQVGTRMSATADATGAIAREMGSWPTWLIAVVFAGLLLERSSGRGFGEALRRGASSGILAWIIIVGQILIGMGVYLMLVRPGHPQVPASFGQLLEVSWAGGHGTSSAMGVIYAGQGFPQGRDLAFFLATLGLVYGVVSGLVLVNLAVRRGWTHAGSGGTGRIPVVSGVEPRRHPVPAAFARTRNEVLEPLALQVVILAAAFGVGFVLQQGFIAGAGVILGQDNPDVRGEAIEFVGNIPLFLFTLLGGWIVREAMHALRIGDLIDAPSVQRMVGVAMDFLIVAAITTMRVESLREFFMPVALLFLLAAAWTALCLLVLAPRLLPRKYWFELGLLNYGFATANTPQGLMLLRIVDPELRTGAAEDYAIAAPLSAPFVGGGVITLSLPYMLQHVHAGWVIGASVVGIGVLYVLGRAVAGRRSAAEASVVNV